MRFTIVVNVRLEGAEETADRVRALLEKEHRVETNVLTREGIEFEEHTAEGEPDVVVTVGGDGTILRALQHYDSKVLGLNMGEVGFLTEVQPEELDAALKQVVEGDYIIDERLRLKSLLNGERMVDALNDQVIGELLDDRTVQQALSEHHNISGALAQLLIARALERIADQATNISEEVIYWVKGLDIRHHSADPGTDALS